MELLEWLREQYAILKIRLFSKKSFARGEYIDALKNMPEPYRSQLLYGDFKPKK